MKLAAGEIELREVRPDDLPVFYENQLDPEANRMAAFTAKDPSDKTAFQKFWDRILSDPTVQVRTILYRGQVTGSVLSFRSGRRREVSYWIGRQFWGRGIATEALARYTRLMRGRALYARVARDNTRSIRVLEKCGFVVCGQEVGFANARGQEIEELLLKRGNPRKHNCAPSEPAGKGIAEA